MVRGPCAVPAVAAVVLAVPTSTMDAVEVAHMAPEAPESGHTMAAVASSQAAATAVGAKEVKKQGHRNSSLSSAQRQQAEAEWCVRHLAFGRVGLGLMAAAAAEEVLQHMGADPRVEETNSAAAEELVVDDEEILRFMDSADGYLLLMDSLSSLLRQGWLDLASARHSLGASRVSSTLYDHKEQSAATKLQVDYSADLQPSESNPHFSLLKWCLQEEPNSSDVCAQDSTKPKLRYRGSEATPGDGGSESNATTAKSSTGVHSSKQVQSARSKALSVLERWCHQNYEQPKFPLKQHLN